MAFSNSLREHGARNLDSTPHRGTVVNVDDPMKLSRVQIRIPHLHKGIADKDLPWVTPGGQASSNSGSNNQGTHGPVPQVGTQVNVRFRDDSQYHPEYISAPIHDKTRMNEFAPQGKLPQQSNAQSQQGQQTQQNNADNEYSSDYPYVSGNVDPSGNLRADNTKRDTKERTHVSGTSHSIDGKGNSEEIVNGGWSNPNKDAKEKHPKGKSIHVHGDCVIYVSGNVKIHGGDNVEVVSAKEVTVSAGQKLFLSAGQRIAFQAPSITSNVEIALSPGKPTVNPTKPKEAKSRTRPKVEALKEE